MVKTNIADEASDSIVPTVEEEENQGNLDCKKSPSKEVEEEQILSTSQKSHLRRIKRLIKGKTCELQ